MTDAEKIKEINSLIDEIGKVIESNNKPDGIPGTILATNSELLAMADMARRQVATLTTQEEVI